MSELIHSHNERAPASSDKHASLLDTQPLIIVNTPPGDLEDVLRAILVEAIGGATPEDPRVHRLAFSIAAAISNGAALDDLETEVPGTIARIFLNMADRDTLRHLTCRITAALRVAHSDQIGAFPGGTEPLQLGRETG